MNTFEKMAYWQRVGQHINPRKATIWFLGINIPAVIIINILIAIFADYGSEPSPRQLLIRGFIALACFGIGLVFFYIKVFLPAIREEANQEALNKKAAQVIRGNRR